MNVRMFERPLAWRTRAGARRPAAAPALLMALLMAGLCLAARPALARDIYVNGSVAVSGDGSSAAPYKSIQEGINSSADTGDTVYVAAGTYTGATNPMVTWTAKSVALIGAGAGSTIVDGESARQCMYLTNVPNTARIEGFTFQNGKRGRGGAIYFTSSSPTVIHNTFSANYGSEHGGAMFLADASSPTLANNTFSGNSAFQKGGAMFLDSSSPTLTNNTFTSNSARWGGGAMRLNYSSPTLTDNTFTNNSANERGGAMELADSSPTITNNTFTGSTAGLDGGAIHLLGSSPTLVSNTFTSNTANGGGGALNLEWYSSPPMTNNTFTGNSANGGGAMHFYAYSSPAITNSAFTNNSAVQGGAMFVLSIPAPALTNCTFRGNSATSMGAAMYLSGSPTLTNCAFTGNSAWWDGALYLHSASPVLTNCILWGNSSPNLYINMGIPTLTYSDVEGGYAGEGNFSADPLFADAPNGDLHLQPESPCIGTGVWAAGVPATDLDGHLRPNPPSIGAYEGSTAHHLAFSSGPANTTAGAGIPVQVTVYDAANAVATDFFGLVTLSVKSGPGALSGTYQALAVAGVAALSPRLNAPGTYILTATTGALAVDSGAFDVLPTLSVSAVTLAEGDAGTTTYSFTVSLLAPAGPGGVTFDIATADDTATTADNDYVARALIGQTIPAGSSTYTFDVQVNGDATHESAERFFVNLSNATGAAIADGQGAGTITNDDPVPSLSINDVSIAEGDAGTATCTFTVSLSNPSAQTVGVNCVTADGTAAAGTDYLPSSGTLTFAPGETTKTIGVPALGDLRNEADETFTVNLSGPSNATLADGQGAGTITNDDASPAVAADEPAVTVPEDATAANTGTWSDAEGDTVTLTASAGTVVRNDDGTWSWSLATTDGPAQSRTVTITADDGNGLPTTATFALTVENVAPVVTAPAGQATVQTVPRSFALGSFSDAGAEASWAVVVDWGDGTGPDTFAVTQRGTLPARDHTYATPGNYTVTITVTDPDGGTGTGSFTVDVRPVLAFRVQPTSSLLMQNITPAVEVALVDSLGNPVAGRTDAVTLVLAGGPAGARIYGTTTVAAVNGVARFPGLRISRLGGYRLMATSGALAPVASAPFSVVSPAPASLRFVSQPAGGTARAALPAFQAEVLDGRGCRVTTGTYAIRLSLARNPGRAVLTGATANAVAGVATFDGVTLSKAGAGYVLNALAARLSGATSAAFAIAP